MIQGKFPCGRLLATPGVLAAVSRIEINRAIGQHLRGDWGILCDSDKRLNDQALKDGDRLLSAYEDRNGRKFWIITEADRSATTVLLPEEY